MDSYESAARLSVLTKEGKASNFLRTMDVGFFWCLFVFVSLSPFIRSFGGLLLFAFLVIEILYVVATRSVVVHLPILAFTFLGALYVVLSYANVMPDSWTRFYLSSSIPQQASFVAVLYPTFLAARRQWHFLKSTSSGYWRILALGIAGAICSQILGPELLRSDVREIFLPPGNGGFFMFLAVFYFLFSNRRNAFFGVALAIAIAGSLFSPQLQTQLLYVLAIALLVTPWPRLTVVAWCAIITATYIYAYFNAEQIWRLDPNSGIRAFFARDAMTALWDSYGLGIGFGKEATKNIYPMIDHIHKKWDTNFDSFFMVSVHNSFTAIFFRLGIVGGLLWLWIATIATFPPKWERLDNKRFYSAVYGAMFIATFTNVGLESPTFSPAIAVAVGILVGARERNSKNLRQETLA